MKSEKAEAILSHVCNHAEFFEAEESVVPYLDAVSAVEQAESDRYAKAVEAFRESCPFHFEGWCHKYTSKDEEECVGNDDCGHQDRFIQKLNEE